MFEEWDESEIEEIATIERLLLEEEEIAQQPEDDEADGSAIRRTFNKMDRAQQNGFKSCR